MPGKPGKGFAVVADETCQLSEQTKNASANITEIIDKLNDDTKRANESIENSVASVEKQNELIENTREKFGNVGETVERLMEDTIRQKKISRKSLMPRMLFPIILPTSPPPVRKWLPLPPKGCVWQIPRWTI